MGDKSGFDALTWLLDPKKGEDAATLKILRTLINGGLEVRRVVQAGPRVGSTSLILAASSGFAKVVAQLCAASADVEHKEPSGKNALMYAVAKEHPDFVRVLCDARADPLAEDARGFTPLRWHCSPTCSSFARFFMVSIPKDVECITLPWCDADVDQSSDLHFTAVRRSLRQVVGRGGCGDCSGGGVFSFFSRTFSRPAIVLAPLGCILCDQR